MDKSWAVIKLPDENTVEAVPTAWLCGNHCFWPPWTKDRINTAIKNCKPPDVESWQKYPFTSFRNNVFDDYDCARKTIQKATFMSDLDSPADSSHSDSGHRKRRKVLTTTLTRFASFELSESDDADTPSSLPVPPKYKGIEKKIQSSLYLNENDRDTNVGVATVSATTNVFDNTENISSGYSMPQLQQITGTEKKIQRNLCTNENDKDKNVGTAIVSATTHNNNTENIFSGHSTTELQQITGYLKQIIRKQNIPQSTITDLGEDITEIKRKMDQKNLTTIDDTGTIFTILNLPIDCDTDVQHLEDYLNGDVQMNSAVRAHSGSFNHYP